MLNSAALRPTLGPALRKLGVALFIGIALISRAALGDELQQANKLLKTGEYRQALESVDKILASQPNSPQARFLKGVILTEQGDSKDAVVVFQKLTQDYPELPEPYNNLAVIYASQGEYEKARAALEQSIRTHPSYATAYENLGDVYAKLASRAYDKALRIDSSNSTAQNKLALLRELIGGPPGSINEVQHVALASAASAPGKPAPEQPAEVKAPVPSRAEAKAAEPKAAEAKPAAPKPVAPKPAVSAPAQPVMAHEASTADVNRAIITTVEGWAKAWSRKDVDAYLSFYAKDFETPKGQSRAAWERLRRARLSAPKSISVTLASPEVRITANDLASVTFRQTYRSNFIRSTTMKTLVLERAGGRWLIRQERVGR
ncbi:MAG TPA: tetratricopeptide repeat protein [Burkholderiales bacterium]|nr:tetratricopeptide repeat protein [Burkholderiales bacterium]